MIHLLFLLFCLKSTFAASQVTADDIDDLREELRAEFDESGRLRPLLTATVRLIFHDCVGPQEVGGDEERRCNGCINYDHPGNAGLPENALDDLDVLYQSWSNQMSRADFWAAAATIALEYAQELDKSNDVLPVIPYYFGRTDCGSTSQATEMEDLIHPFSGWDTIRRWFWESLSLSERETVAIIGAHTLGQTHVEASGFSSLPWVEINQGPDVLNNAFYDNVLNEHWTHSQSPTGLWEWKDNSDSIIMLDADMSLVIDIDPYLDEDTGEVTCPSKGCPESEVIDIAQEFANSNQLWLNEFAAVMDKLIVSGYDVDEELTVVAANPVNNDNGNDNGDGDESDDSHDSDTRNIRHDRSSVSADRGRF